MGAYAYTDHGARPHRYDLHGVYDIPNVKVDSYAVTLTTHRQGLPGLWQPSRDFCRRDADGQPAAAPLDPITIRERNLCMKEICCR